MIVFSTQPERISRPISFGWSRNSLGEGSWVCLEWMGQLPPQTVLHHRLQRELSLAAKKAGLSESGNFMPRLPEAKKNSPKRSRTIPVAVRTKKSKRKANKKVLLGGFNPFN